MLHKGMGSEVNQRHSTEVLPTPQLSDWSAVAVGQPNKGFTLVGPGPDHKGHPWGSFGCFQPPPWMAARPMPYTCWTAPAPRWRGSPTQQIERCCGHMSCLGGQLGVLNGGRSWWWRMCGQSCLVMVSDGDNGSNWFIINTVIIIVNMVIYSQLTISTI